MLTVLVHGTAIEKRRIVARDGRKIRSHGIAARRAQPHLGRIIRPRAGLDLFGPRPRGQPQKLLDGEGGLLGGHGRDIFRSEAPFCLGRAPTGGGGAERVTFIPGPGGVQGGAAYVTHSYYSENRIRANLETPLFFSLMRFLSLNESFIKQVP